MKKYPFLASAFLLLSFVAAKAQPTIPSNPIAGNSSICTTTVNGLPVEQCSGSQFITDFENGTYVNNTGTGNNSLGLNAVWHFPNVFPNTNASVTVDAMLNATLDMMDDNTATDELGVSVKDFFSPKISPDVVLNTTSRRGYVQFTIRFYTANSGNGYSVLMTPIDNMNFVSYDADGSFKSGGSSSAAWYRETRVALSYASNNPLVLASSGTELVQYNYTEPGSPTAVSWRGFAGSVYERTGMSRCAEVASSYKYGSGSNAKNVFTFRFGYDFKSDGSYNMGQSSRQYGARFGCYNFPSQLILPVKLLSFNGAYKNQAALLNWSTESETNFDHFEVERSSNGIDFISINNQLAKGSTTVSSYQLTDNLSAVVENVLYYRLKMIDKNGDFTYSQVVLIKKDSKTITGITINPNPVSNGEAMVNLTANRRTTVELQITDISGRILWKQTETVYEGNNSIPIDVQRFQSGIYTLQMMDGSTMTVTKFSVIK